MLKLPLVTELNEILFKKSEEFFKQNQVLFGSCNFL